MKTRLAIIQGDIALIPLGKNAKGGYAIVNKEFAYLADDNWRLTYYGYAIRSKDKKLLHRVVLKAEKGMVIDHRDGNPLNNRLSNMRFCTQAENCKNQIIKNNNTSGYKGVSWHKPSKRYVAKVKSNYKEHIAGYFIDAIEAARAYNELAKELHGEFARLNNVVW